ncbi:hypothetical protein AB3X91_38740 [Paraburkholderia sp. BR14263]|uniref:hypothetical protein n=1 Tax=unclassified Paraburkholderia TaxID=2615204 RepID=UPI0034CFAA71
MDTKQLTDEQIDAFANEGRRNPTGGIYATRVHEFARAIEAAVRTALASSDAARASADANFFAGVCTALQVIAVHDQGVLWKEIVRACGVDKLLQFASHIEPDEWELAGFAKYARGELGAKKPSKRAAPVAPAAAAASDDTRLGGTLLAVVRLLGEAGYPADTDIPDAVRDLIAKAKTPAAQPDERAAFEAWNFRNLSDGPRAAAIKGTRRGAGYLEGTSTACRWEGWQARAAHPAEQRMSDEFPRGAQ